jgi:hypothetical protein
MFEACGNYQWAREFLRNALEAGAGTIEFGIEWQAVEKLGLYRRTIHDNGCGMSSDELLRFFSTLGEGAKRIGGVHENFGVGAKVAALPWNPEGVVVLSYKDGGAAMLRIMLNPETAEYQLIEFQTDYGPRYVVDPNEVTDWLGDVIDWSAVAPAWVRDHGTSIVLLGSEEHPDTILGNPKAGERDIKGLSVYLNTRFWNLTAPTVRVAELRKEKKNSWPLGPDDRDDTRRANNRVIQGAKHYLTEVKATDGKLGSSDVILLDENRVLASWYLWEGERPHIDSYAKKTGYIAVRYRDELFQLTSNKAHFRWFGVIESKVQQNLTIILEPQLYEPQGTLWGIQPEQSRNRLIFTGGARRALSCRYRIGALSSQRKCRRRFVQRSTRHVENIPARFRMRSTERGSKTSSVRDGGVVSSYKRVRWNAMLSPPLLSSTA